MTRIIVSVGLVAAILTAASGGLFGKFRLLAVSSGSMGAAASVGSLIAVVTHNSYDVGDIISFREAGGGTITTHRISRIEEDSGEVTYFTKGDRNEEEDLRPVYFNKVVGKVTVVIPKLGGVLPWLKEMISRAILIDQEASSGNSLAAGTMDLKISDDDEEAGDSLAVTWEGDGLRPGQGEVSADLRIKNAGTAAADHIHVFVENSTSEGEGPGEDESDPMDANLEIKALQYNEVDIKSYITDKNGNGSIDLDDWEKTPEEDFSLELTDLDINHVLSLTVGLRPQTSETNQGDVVTTTFSIIGHQLNEE